jgi:uncharacterized protein (DUF2141 family)
VVQWEKREETTPCSGAYGPWTILSGSQGTSVWWTNDLQKTTQYQVLLENGACPTKHSPVYTVTVKPPLNVTISANKTDLCPPGPVVLTAQTTWGSPCNYPVTYQWFLNGAPIPGATLPTYSPTTGGNYYVVVNGQACGKAKSNVITICDLPHLVIIGDCCVCPGKTMTLTANVVWTPNGCQAPSCTYLWNTSATTPSIQVSQPGTYSVSVNCGGCQMSASLTVGDCGPPQGKAEICITKFNDLNGDGKQQSNEPGLPNWTFTVSGGIGTFTTGPQGSICFGVPAPGTYTISEVLQSGWTPTTLNPQTVTVSSGQLLNLSFGNKKVQPDSAEICITKFNDLNGDGKQQSNEPGLPNWTFTVSGGIGNITTGPSGSMCFSVPAPGTYTITEVLQSGWTSTTPNPQTVIVLAGQLVNLSFGNKK